MPINRLHSAVCVLATASLAACASNPAGGKSPGLAVPAAQVVWQPPAPGLDFLQLSMGGALPLLEEETDGDALLASNVAFGADELLRYEASYLVDANGIVAAVDDEAPALTAPDRFGGQRLGQKVELHLPGFAGAPLSLAVTNELSDNWMEAADGRARRELARFSWSPGRATVDVQWAGEGPVVDASSALRCNFHSTVTVPTRENRRSSQGLELSGSDCNVRVDEGQWAGAEARAWGLSYVWRSDAEESAAELSMVDAASSRAVRPDGDPGYELDLRHRREFGSLTAGGVLSLRRSQVVPTANDESGVTDTSWAANASLTWQLPQASLTANWARGVDPLWFTPESGRRADHFGLAINLSRWLDDQVAGPPPRLAMNWNWSERRMPNEKRIADNSVSIDVALVF